MEEKLASRFLREIVVELTIGNKIENHTDKTVYGCQVDYTTFATPKYDRRSLDWCD